MIYQKLDNFLRDTDDKISNQRRQRFFDIIKTARGKGKDNTAVKSIPDLTEYVLTDPPFQEDLEKVGRTGITEWLTSRTSNFFFPKPESGPDLLFFLKPRGKPDSRERILFAIQVFSPPTFGIRIASRLRADR